MYSKKQMKPLIDKYQINAETNKLFLELVDMFDGQPNYQSWAVKVVFSQAASFDEVKEIAEWASKNASTIKTLSKQNIVSYSSKTALSNLKKEMHGADIINFVKNIASHFNTEQKKMIMQELFKEDTTPLSAYTDTKLNQAYDMLTKFNKMSMKKKNNFYSNSSAVHDYPHLIENLRVAIETKYEWNKDDMLAFLANNTNDCKVVYDHDNYVIASIGSFNSSRKVCGGGRTQWCITTGEGNWNSYVGHVNSRVQYFFFDFNRKETDCFAHVGFTVENCTGIRYAQTCNNCNMLDTNYKQGDESWNIHSLLKHVGCDMSVFMRLSKNCAWNWDEKTLIEYVNKSPKRRKLCYSKNGVIAIEITNYDDLSYLIGHTLIRYNNYTLSKQSRVIVVFNLNEKYDSAQSVAYLQFVKDNYESFSLNACFTTYNSDETNSNILDSFGITIDDVIDRTDIPKEIMLHKYIDENNENAAIKLIESEGADFDINYKHNNHIPIFSVVTKKMYNLFGKIVNHPKYKSDTIGGFGETLLETLLFIYSAEEISSDAESKESLEKMINVLLVSSNDFNTKDINDDTAINIACEYPEMLWVVKVLASKREVDINVINDFECAALGNCIRNKNLAALTVIGMRPDLKVTENDKKLAKSYSIKLSDYINPTEDIYDKWTAETVESEELVAASV